MDRAGDNEAVFAEWMRLHRGVVIKVARSFTSTPEDRDDLIQEILIRVWASVDNYRGEAKVSTWIYRVALNRALTWQRSDSKRRSHQQSLIDAADLAGTERADDAVRLDAVYAAIRLLPWVDRALMLLSLDGFSYAEMADVVGLSETNVGARLSRARSRLTTELEKGNQ